MRSAGDASGGRWSWLPLALAAYFVAQGLLRWAVVPALNFDEAEMVVLSQVWAWGYGAQPPLYTWLQKAVFALLGEGVAGLVVLKQALLLVLFLAMHAVARRVLREETAAAAATLSLMLLPQIGWESQRALTHSVLAVAVAAMTLLAFLRLAERRRLGDYALFGLLLALGVLSKQNFVVFAAGLLLAAAMMPDYRPGVATPRLLISLLTAALVLAAPGRWMLANGDKVLSRLHKFELTPAGEGLGTLAAGVADAVASAAAFVLPLVLACALVGLGAAVRRPAPGRLPPGVRLLLLAAALGLVVVVLAVAVGGAGNVKQRWLMPVLFFVPPAMVAWLRGRVPPARLRLLAWLAGAAALLHALLLPLPALVPALADESVERARPYAALARRIVEETGFSGGTLLTGHFLTGGNLALHLPETAVLTPEYGHLDLPTPEPVLLVWEGDASPPPALAALYDKRFGGTPQGQVRDLTASDAHAPQEGFSLKVLLLE